MPDPTPPADPLKLSEEAAADLADALNTIGIVLPSLRGDWPALNGAPLVQLGGAPPHTVHQLAACIRQRHTPEPTRPPQASEVTAS
jgi:hypothetical protein